MEVRPSQASEMIIKYRKLLGHPAVQKWVAQNAMEMF